MLHNTPNFLSPINNCLQELKNAESSFFLTGSKFFGGAHSKSDWDFISSDDKSVEEFLVGLGFKLNEDVQGYLDPMTSKVLTKRFCHCEFNYRGYDEGVVMTFEDNSVQHRDECESLKIDIQLCHDLDTKLKIRDTLYKGFRAEPLPGDKYQRNKLWTMVYNLVKTD